MEKILVVLIIILVVMVALLVFITIINKKKNVIDMEEEFLDERDIPEIVDDFIEEDIVEVPDKKNEEKISDLDDPFVEFENNFKDEQEEEIEKIDIENEVTQIIDLMQVNSKNLIDKVSVYEDEQEENAIISYSELLNAVKNKKEVQEELKFEEFKETPKQDSVVNQNQQSKKFKSSEAISPLGRINKSNNEDSYKSDIKNTNMYKDTNNTDDDFLKSLRDFREKL